MSEYQRAVSSPPFELRRTIKAAGAADMVDAHLVSFIDPASIEADQYQALRLAVERQDAPQKVIAVTSAVAVEGKTITVLNLAGALANAPGVRVLVCDLDVRNPCVGARLGLPAESAGLVDLIRDPSLTLDAVIHRHPRFPLWVLPAGDSSNIPCVSYELLQSPRLSDLIRQARQQYDYILLDTSPLTPVPDPRLIADLVDGFIVVVAAHRTRRRLLEHALGLMDPSKIMGLVFNGDDHSLSGRYHYSRYRHTVHARSR